MVLFIILAYIIAAMRSITFSYLLITGCISLIFAASNPTQIFNPVVVANSVNVVNK